MELQQLKTALLEDFQGIKEDEEFAKMKSILWKKEAKEREDFDAVQSGLKHLKLVRSQVISYIVFAYIL